MNILVYALDPQGQVLAFGWIRDLVLAASGETEAPPFTWEETFTPLTATTTNAPAGSDTVSMTGVLYYRDLRYAFGFTSDFPARPG